MPAAGILLLAGAAAVYGLRAPVRRALVLLVATTVLVPATLVVPNGLSPYPTFGRVVLVAVALNLLGRHRRGELPLGVERLTPVHGALAALVAVSLTCGVALAAEATPTDAALGSFAGVLEQLVFFTVVLVAVRAIDDPRWVLGAVAAVAVASAGIAVVERLVDASWGRVLFDGLAGQQGTDPAKVLERRGGDARVRAGAQFALQFAWVAVALLPSVVVAARKRAAWWVGAGVVVLAILWSVSRSAVPGVGLALVVLWLAGGRDRRVGAALVAGAAVALLVVLAAPSLTGNLGRDADEGSIESRTLKVPAVLSFLVDDPWTGLGHNGLDPAGIASTDNSFLLAYAETGVVGATALVVALVAGLAYGARGLRESDARLPQAAALAGATALVAGAFAFDAFSLQGSAGPFWLLVAVAVACGERVAGPIELGWPASGRLAWPAAGLVLGLVALALAPRHAATSLRFDALPVRSVVAAPDPQIVLGRRLVDTGCPAAEAAAQLAGAETYCRELDAPGSFLLRVEAGDAATVARAASAARDAVDVALDEVAVAGLGGAEGRPTGATAAPLVLALLGGAAALLVPARTRELVPA